MFVSVIPVDAEHTLYLLRSLSDCLKFLNAKLKGHKFKFNNPDLCKVYASEG